MMCVEIVLSFYGFENMKLVELDDISMDIYFRSWMDIVCSKQNRLAGLLNSRFQCNFFEQTKLTV